MYQEKAGFLFLEIEDLAIGYPTLSEHRLAGTRINTTTLSNILSVIQSIYLNKSQSLHKIGERSPNYCCQTRFLCQR